MFGLSDPQHSKHDLVAPTDWDRIVQDRTDNLDYTAWRRPLRKGYMMYRTRTVLHHARARDVRRFVLDDLLK